MSRSSDLEFGGDWIPEGFQVKKVRRPRKNVPEWANNDYQLRWRIFSGPIRRYRIAYLYWRCGWNAREIAEEVGVRPANVKRTIQILCKAQ